MYNYWIARPPLTSLRLISGRPYGYWERNSVASRTPIGGAESQSKYMWGPLHIVVRKMQGRTRLREGSRSIVVLILCWCCGPSPLSRIYYYSEKDPQVSKNARVSSLSGRFSWNFQRLCLKWSSIFLQFQIFHYLK